MISTSYFFSYGAGTTHKTKSYQETMNIDIENINKIENSHKHYTKQWRKIYEVIQQEFFDETEFFQIFFQFFLRIM